MAKLARGAVAAPPTSRVLESWLTALDLAGRSPKTLRLYRETLAGFIAVTDDPPVRDITPEQIRLYLIGLRETHKPASIATRFRCLRAFLAWCEREGRIDRIPTRTVDPPQTPPHVPEGFTDAELARFLAACNPRTAIGARDRALLLVLCGTALRLAEVTRLKRDDVLNTRTTEQYIRLRGKGGKERTVSIEPLARRAIAEWLEYRNDDDPALWLGERGPLSTSGVYQIIKRWGREADIADCHPHRFRNTALANMLTAGMDPAAVQRIAGHASMGQLQHYVNYNEERRANDQLMERSPLSRIDWTGGKKRRGK